MEKPALDGPRERLQRVGVEALSDAELVALLLRTGAGGTGALAAAGTLLAARGGLRGLLARNLRELQSQPGLGPAKAASIVAALEIGRRVATRRLEPGTSITGPADVFRHFHPRLRDASRERFLTLHLDGRHRVLGEAEVSRGTLTASLVHPREVFRPALRAGAAALIVVHNHPSGDPTPSLEDHRVTQRLCEAGELLGIPLLDHVVVAERGYRSLKDAAGQSESGRPEVRARENP